MLQRCASTGVLCTLARRIIPVACGGLGRQANHGSLSALGSPLSARAGRFRAWVADPSFKGAVRTTLAFGVSPRRSPQARLLQDSWSSSAERFASATSSKKRAGPARHGQDVRRRVSKATSRGLDGARVRDCGSPFPSNGGQRRVGSDEPTTVSPLHLKSN